MSRHWMPWTQSQTSSVTPRLHGFGKTARTLDLVNVAWGARLGENVDGQETHNSLRAGFNCDTSQDVLREPWGSLGTVTTSLFLKKKNKTCVSCVVHFPLPSVSVFAHIMFVLSARVYACNQITVAARFTDIQLRNGYAVLWSRVVPQPGLASVNRRCV